jgi:riboflavin transporter FmnP
VVELNRARKTALIAIFGALSIVLTAIRVPLHFGNPNLGSTAISLSALFLPPGEVFIVGIVKGIGVTIWTAQPLIEIPAGLGDGIMGIITHILLRRFRPGAAIVIGQICRYLTTSTSIALTWTILSCFRPELQRTGQNILQIFIGFWMWISFPAVSLSIAANSLLAGFIAEMLYRRHLIRHPH